MYLKKKGVKRRKKIKLLRTRKGFEMISYNLENKVVFFIYLEDVAAEILRHSEHENYRRGDVIIKQGDEGNRYI